MRRPEDPGRHILDGTVRVLLAEALFPLTALITAAFLTRRLGPQNYGLLALAVTLVVWIETNIASLFSRATIKFVSDAQDWRSVAAAIVRLHLAASGAAMLLVWLFAIPISRLFSEPMLTPYLCLFALDIPIFGLAQAHRNILVGIGGFSEGALARAGRWITRLVLIVLLVGLGLSVTGAILASIGASVVELAIARWYVRPPISLRARRYHLPFREHALPLFLSASCLSCYNGLALFVLKASGGTAEQAGIYNAAQNLSLLPGLFASAFSPLLLSTLSRLLSRGELGPAKDMSRRALRIVLWLLPLAGVVAGAAPEIVRLFFGAPFEPAAPLLTVLIFGAVAMVMISVALATLTAAGKLLWTLTLTGPLVPLAVLGCLWMIPPFGLLGASLATTAVAWLGAVAALLAVHRLWQVFPPGTTFARTVLVSGLAYMLAGLWETSGFFVVLKLFVVGSVSAIALLLLGEFGKSELSTVGSLLSRKAAPDQYPHEV